MRKIIYTILIIGWMLMIFMFSNQPADESTKLSDGFISNTIGNIYKFFDKDVTEDKLIEVKEIFTTPVRKTAHFTIYLILGILIMLLMSEYNISNKKQIFISILICFLYSVSDEVHQLFVSGRSGEIRDVFIDTTGSILGILVTNRFFSKKLV